MTMKFHDTKLVEESGEQISIENRVVLGLYKGILLETVHISSCSYFCSSPAFSQKEHRPSKCYWKGQRWMDDKYLQPAIGIPCPPPQSEQYKAPSKPKNTLQHGPALALKWLHCQHILKFEKDLFHYLAKHMCLLTCTKNSQVLSVRGLYIYTRLRSKSALLLLRTMHPMWVNNSSQYKLSADR